jgi:hypothetical protein
LIASRIARTTDSGSVAIKCEDPTTVPSGQAATDCRRQPSCGFQIIKAKIATTPKNAGQPGANQIRKSEKSRGGNVLPAVQPLVSRGAAT